MSTILVTGGTGRLGRELLPRLIAGGHEVRALVRRADASLPTGVEAVRGDLGAPPLAPGLFDRVQHVIHMASGASGGQIDDVDLRGTQTLIEAMQASGGRPHLLYLSIVGVEKVAFPLYRAKVEIEAMIAASGLPWTSLRTTQFHELIWDVFDRPPPTPFLARGMRYQPLACAEVADFIVGLLGQPPAGGIVEMGGPEVSESSELASVFAEVTGRPQPALRPEPAAGTDLDALLTPNHREGRLTWREFLTQQRPSFAP